MVLELRDVVFKREALAMLLFFVGMVILNLLMALVLPRLLGSLR